MSRIAQIRAIGNYARYYRFADHVEGTIDLEDRLLGPVFERLLDPARFAEASIDEFGAIRRPHVAPLPSHSS